MCRWENTARGGRILLKPSQQQVKYMLRVVMRWWDITGLFSIPRMHCYDGYLSPGLSYRGVEDRAWYDRSKHTISKPTCELNKNMAVRWITGFCCSHEENTHTHSHTHAHTRTHTHTHTHTKTQGTFYSTLVYIMIYKTFLIKHIM